MAAVMFKSQRSRYILRRMLHWAVIIVLCILLVGATRLLLLRQQVERYRAFWIEQANMTPAPDALWYVALGDSSAQGIGASHPEKGYVGLLAHSLRAETGRPVHVVNLSATGARLNDLIEKQLPLLEQLELPPDAVVTLAVGSNNIPKYDHERFRTEMQKIIERMPPQTIVGDVPYFGGGRANSGEQSALAASKIIAELAGAHGLRLAELHKVTKEQRSIRDFAADFFHPSNHGYKKWHQAFWPVLRTDVRSI